MNTLKLADFPESPSEIFLHFPELKSTFIGSSKFFVNVLQFEAIKNKPY